MKASHFVRFFRLGVETNKQRQVGMLPVVKTVGFFEGSSPFIQSLIFMFFDILMGASGIDW